MTKDDIKKELDDAGIEYEPTAKKSELEALLPEVEEEQGEILEDVVEKAEAKEETPKKKGKGKDLGTLGGKAITGIEDIEIGNKKLLKVSLSDRSETILSKKDLDNQIK